MTKLSSNEKEEIIRRRKCKSDKTGKTHRVDTLIIHHKDRNTDNNDPRNLRVLTKKEHEDLHGRNG